MKNTAIMMGLLLCGVVTTNAYAEETGVKVRKDINALFFGGREDSQRYVSQGATCEVVIRNDTEAKTTEITVDDRAFSVSESDTNLIEKEEYDVQNGVISVLSGNHQTDSLVIERIISGTQKSFRVSIGNGIGFPVSCEVF